MLLPSGENQYCSGWHGLTVVEFISCYFTCGYLLFSCYVISTEESIFSSDFLNLTILIFSYTFPDLIPLQNNNCVLLLYVEATYYSLAVASDPNTA